MLFSIRHQFMGERVKVAAERNIVVMYLANAFVMHTFCWLS